MNSSIRLAVQQADRVLAPQLRWAWWLTLAALPLIVVASVVGLINSATYARNPATIIPAMQGQDLVTLLALPVLGVALYFSWRGSARAILLWIGVLSYLFYTYTGAALGYYFAAMTPLYILIFSLMIFALGAALRGLDAAGIAQRFDAATPRRATAVFVALIGLLLALLEFGQIAAFIADGQLPPGVAAAGGGAYFVYALDLGLVLPLAILGAVLLWQGRAWGYAIAGPITVKAATMGLALLMMNWFNLQAGQPVDPVELLSFYALLTVGGLVMAIWFFRHCE